MNAAFDISLSDAHAHLGSDDALGELARRHERGILTCFSAGTLAEWERVNGLLAQASDHVDDTLFLTSFGIHPWEAEHHEPQACEAAYAECAAIGEIGLDTVWCDVPLARQKATFEEQLQLAVDLHKPIVLHTKGAEVIVADMVRGFPEPVLVHWYSGPLDAFERFAEQDCFFTLGPDCSNGNDLNHAMMTALPLKHLLIETDGIEGITWAIDENPRLAQNIARFYGEGGALIDAALLASTHALADVRGISAHEAATQMQNNMKRFYCIEQVEHKTARVAVVRQIGV